MSGASGAVPSTILDTLEGSDAVLLLAPAISDAGTTAEFDLLAGESIRQTNILEITVTDSPDDRLQAWRHRLPDALPGKIAIINVNGKTRSTEVESVALRQPTGRIRLSMIEDPRDLTQIGIAMTEVLSDWRRDDNRIVATLHSLTALMQFCELERLYRFLHAVIGQLSAADGRIVVHMDPSAHDEAPIRTLVTLFDAVLEYEDGEYSVSTR